MTKSNKPVVWFPFAAGGTVIAFFIPVIVVLTFMAALGHIPPGLSYDRMHAFAGNGAPVWVRTRWLIPGNASFQIRTRAHARS